MNRLNIQAVVDRPDKLPWDMLQQADRSDRGGRPGEPSWVVTVWNVADPGDRKVYMIRAKSDNSAAQEGIRRFDVAHAEAEHGGIDTEQLEYPADPA